MRRRFGVLISGNGSTLQSILDSPEAVQVVVVISSSEKAYGVLRARRSGVPVEIIPAELRSKEKKDEAESWILSKLDHYQVQTLFLAGFMKILSENFIKRFKMRRSREIFNIHPSLLPLHKGLNAFEQALEKGDRFFGVTIHHVEPNVDSGSLLSQRKIEFPKHREKESSSLLLHLHEQHLIRETMKRLLWPT